MAGADDSRMENREVFSIILNTIGESTDVKKYPWKAAAEKYSSSAPKSDPETSLPVSEPATRAFLFDNYKYIITSKGSEELFNLETDFREKENLIESDPDRVRQGRELHKEFLETVNGYVVKESDSLQELNERQFEQLKGLGYIQ